MSRTPFPIRFYDGSGTCIQNCSSIKTDKKVPMQTILGCQNNQTGGNPTPYPYRYFNPTKFERNNCGMCGDRYNNVIFDAQLSGQIDRCNCGRDCKSGCEYPPVKMCSCGAKRLRNKCACRGNMQHGGGTTGAPYTIPNYGINPNMGQQKQDSSKATTGFSYRFATGVGCSPFCQLYGSNLPTFNNV